MNPSSALDPRLEQLLQAVVEVYQDTAQPVGSQTLVDTGRFSVSSATIRNWFADLDELGLLEQPHTSGGRIPTEAGYRLYLTGDAWRAELEEHEGQLFRDVLLTKSDPVLRAKACAKQAVEVLGLAMFVRFGTSDLYYTGLSALFAQPEFRDWQRVVSLSEVLDRLDEAVQQLTNTSSDPALLVGSASPFGGSCSTVFVGRGDLLIGALGPLRMPYGRTHALLSAIIPLL